MTENRYFNIDVLRILSIFIVVATHFGLIKIPFIFGTLGVILFFIVSGYCIAMTAPRKAGFLSFWKARYIRLLPLFLVCTLAIQLFKSFNPTARPDRMTNWMDYLFTNACLPTFDFPCYYFLRGDYTFVDGSFWSLLVEFRFYLLFSILWYFFKLRKSAVFVLVATSFLCFYTERYYGDRVNDFFMYLPCFAFGMAFYEFERGSKAVGLAGGALSFATFAFFGLAQVQQISILLNHSNIYSYLGCFLVFTFIMLLFKNMNKFANRWLTLFALLSYPIYLLHQEMGYIYIELLRYDLDSFGSGLVAALAAVVLAYLLDRAVNYLVLPRSANNRV